MARKKMAKNIKQKTKKNSRNTPKMKISRSDAMEQSFKNLPSELTAQYDNELANAKKQEIKTSSALKKSAALIKALQKKCDSLSNSKPTASIKKQLAKAKKDAQKATQTNKGLTKELSLLQKQINTLLNKKAMTLALMKEISKFQKSWGKDSKKQTPKKTTKSKRSTSIQPQENLSCDIESMGRGENSQTIETEEVDETIA